jgi:hypothetical protein
MLNTAVYVLKTMLEKNASLESMTLENDLDLQ